nr:MAG TPA: adenine specific DNA methyltransferase [Caudoviricetes sp.]
MCALFLVIGNLTAHNMDVAGCTIVVCVCHAEQAYPRNRPTMKPVPLFAYQIQCSTKPGDIVYDSFGGSGTTLIACEQLQRKAMIMELDPRYVDVIIKRWETLTGESAVLMD